MISVVINVKNGQRYLHRCLNALSRFDNVVLLDNYSTDETLTIARQYSNVDIHSSEFLGMGKLRNLAVNFAKYDWVLIVDSDEVLSSKLVDFLLAFNYTANTIYQIRRYNFYNGYKVESSAWENDWVLRLYNRNQTQFIEDDVHESVRKDNMIIEKIHSGMIYHFPYESINGLIEKTQFYSSLYAKQFFNKKKPCLPLIPVRAFFMFIKCYVLKRGFLDGYEGFVVSSYNAIGVFTKYIKLYELQHRQKIALAVYLDEIGALDRLCEKINKQLLLPERVMILVDNPEDKGRIANLLSKKLSIDYDVQINGTGNVKIMLQEYLKDHEQLEYLAYLDDFDLLKDAKLFNNIRKSILNNKVTKHVSVVKSS